VVKRNHYSRGGPKASFGASPNISIQGLRRNWRVVLFQDVSDICQHIGFEREAARGVAAAIAGGLAFLALAIAYKDPD
jgi:hypothetical protein